jgi:hypothetical protein
MTSKLPKHYYIIFWISIPSVILFCIGLYFGHVDPGFVPVVFIFGMPFLILFIVTKKYEIDSLGYLNVYHFTGIKLKSMAVKEILWVYHFGYDTHFLSKEKKISIPEYYFKTADYMGLITTLSKDKVYREDIEELAEWKKEYRFQLYTLVFFLVLLLIFLIPASFNGTFLDKDKSIQLFFYCLLPLGIIFWILPKMIGIKKELNEIKKNVKLNDKIYS